MVIKKQPINRSIFWTVIFQIGNPISYIPDIDQNSIQKIELLVNFRII